MVSLHASRSPVSEPRSCPRSSRSPVAEPHRELAGRAHAGGRCEPPRARWPRARTRVASPAASPLPEKKHKPRSSSLHPSLRVNALVTPPLVRRPRQIGTPRPPRDATAAALCDNLATHETLRHRGILLATSAPSSSISIRHHRADDSSSPFAMNTTCGSHSSLWRAGPRTATPSRVAFRRGGGSDPWGEAQIIKVLPLFLFSHLQARV